MPGIEYACAGRRIATGAVPLDAAPHDRRRVAGKLHHELRHLRPGTPPPGSHRVANRRQEVPRRLPDLPKTPASAMPRRQTRSVLFPGIWRKP